MGKGARCGTFVVKKKKKEKETPEWMMMEAQHNRINPSINAPQVVRDYTYMTLLYGSSVIHLKKILISKWPPSKEITLRQSLFF